MIVTKSSAYVWCSLSGIFLNAGSICMYHLAFSFYWKWKIKETKRQNKKTNRSPSQISPSYYKSDNDVQFIFYDSKFHIWSYFLSVKWTHRNLWQREREKEMNKIISFSCSRAIEIYSFALFLFSFIRWRVNFCAQMCTWDLVAIWMTEKYTGNTINSAYSYKSQKVKGSRQTNNPKRQY